MKQEIKEGLLGIITRYRTNTKEYNALMLEIERLKSELMKLDSQRSLLYGELIKIREDEGVIMKTAAEEPDYDDEAFKKEIDELVKNI